MHNAPAPRAAGRPFEGAGLSTIQRYRKWAFVAAVVVVAAICPFFRAYWPSGSFVHETIEALGIAVMGLAVIGRAWCTLYIGGRKAQEVVQKGPYSVSRNPLYMFSFLAVLGAGMQSGSLLVGLIMTAISFLILRPVIGYEEALLEKRFGSDFAAYKRRVPRFGPRISTWHDADIIEASPSLFWRTAADGSLFFLSMPIMEAVEFLQRAGDLPVLAFLP